ncbi:MAG: hypothetical protein IJS37_06315 [Bacilli bacterium]|nr:hypothetical protein [Bacilli bacterium]MDY6392258.1 EcoRII N-terminal effector-binding domain-containing protein [Bacilli bacterium]
MVKQSISKVLTPNDIGETGGHQAGMCIPKEKEILDFFPPLDKTVKNPRETLDICTDDGTYIKMSFIYYNGKFFGGTRNEYRLTGMTKYFKENALISGDVIYLSKDEAGNYSISFKKADQKQTNAIVITSTKWKSIKLHGGI